MFVLIIENIIIYNVKDAACSVGFSTDSALPLSSTKYFSVFVFGAGQVVCSGLIRA